MYKYIHCNETHHCSILFSYSFRIRLFPCNLLIYIYSFWIFQSSVNHTKHRIVKRKFDRIACLPACCFNYFPFILSAHTERCALCSLSDCVYRVFYAPNNRTKNNKKAKHHNEGIGKLSHEDVS